MRKFHWSLIGMVALLLAGCESAEAVPQDALTWHPQVAAGETLSDFEALDAMLDSAVNAGGIPGAEVMVVRQGEVIHHQVHGWSHPTDSVKLEKHSIFRICSQTKALTSTAAMILWERGLLDLDDPVEKYIPSFAHLELLDSLSNDTTFTTIPHDRTMTIRHLLTHQSGLSYGEIGDPRFDKIYAKTGVVDLFSTEPITAEENCNRLAKTALIHAPGERWNYSLGLEVVVRVVEVVSGQPFDVFLKSELLDPLGMTDTHFYLPEALAGRLVPVFEPAEEGWKLHEHHQYTTDYPVAGAKTFFGGGAGLPVPLWIMPSSCRCTSIGVSSMDVAFLRKPQWIPSCPINRVNWAKENDGTRVWHLACKPRRVKLLVAVRPERSFGAVISTRLTQLIQPQEPSVF